MSASSTASRGAPAHPLVGAHALKMNGAGNAIVVLDLRGKKATVDAAAARAIGAAPGLAFDQLMVVGDGVGAAAASVRIFNIDGSAAAACGNGTRCVAWALMRDGDTRRMRLDSDAGPLFVERDSAWVFTVDMGAPRCDWRTIPLAAPADTRAVVLTPPAPGAPATFAAVNMGNPHAVFFVDDVAAIDLDRLGPAIETHPAFPDRVNVSFAQVRAPDDILLRVWERGAGATKACGTAACATLVAGACTGRTGRAARVRLPGGDLTIRWAQEAPAIDHVLMTGPVAFEHERTLTAEMLATARPAADAPAGRTP